MSEKQFPPTQIARSVPLEAAAELRKILDAFSLEAIAVYRPDLEAVVQFVEQWKPKAAANMAVEHIGAINEIRIIDDGIDEEQINLVRLNTRVFVPEEIEVVENRVLAVGGNGEELTQETVDAVVLGLEIDAVQGFEDAIRLIRYMADELRLPAKSLDVDDLEQIITDSLELDWHPRDAAQAIHAELYGKGEE